MIKEIGFCCSNDESLTLATIRVGLTKNALDTVGWFVFDECVRHQDDAVFLKDGRMIFVGDVSLHDLYLQFRKQDEAPEMGADSSSNVALIRGVKS